MLAAFGTCAVASKKGLSLDDSILDHPLAGYGEDLQWDKSPEPREPLTVNLQRETGASLRGVEAQ